MSKYKDIVVNELLFRPTVTINPVNIFGLEFAGIDKSPNVFVIEKSNDMDLDNSEFVRFVLNGLLYELDNVIVHENGDRIFLECRNWKEEYIG